MSTTYSSFPYIHRVCYSDTDAAGLVYHARYLDIFERSRAEWLAQFDLSPTKLINDFGILLPVRDLQMDFHKPAYLDDLLQIDQVIERRSRAQVSVRQTAKRKSQDSSATEMELIVSALINIVCVDTTTLKPKALPDWLFLAQSL
ncbi:YbgC/FadM family acyl-CoA thioesterase [Polynucleobacter nymphae]|uniref:YbgC/FadM family acyl-CoA thioesterase n=1 Tax=Polynucleobacter nymphae TaxID=2081043 RepID=UPI001C0AD954|nr:YbgC/FadM family acyl-CoA thioesterase [Polynucleobacter nymphae]MBU3607414.1 YbgC/FadM family acyl-CoA thioesterase [Polynucleobacter nymphae]